MTISPVGNRMQYTKRDAPMQDCAIFINFHPKSRSAPPSHETSRRVRRSKPSFVHQGLASISELDAA
jgi:hypothetical protein